MIYGWSAYISRTDPLTFQDCIAVQLICQDYKTQITELYSRQLMFQACTTMKNNTSPLRSPQNCLLHPQWSWRMEIILHPCSQVPRDFRHQQRGLRQQQAWLEAVESVWGRGLWHTQNCGGQWRIFPWCPKNSKRVLNAIQTIIKKTLLAF